MRKFCSLVSRIFDFHLWGPIVLFVALFNTGLSTKQIEILAPILLVIDILFPIGVYLFFLKTGKISDRDVTKRQERFVLFGVGVITSLFSTILVFFIANELFFTLHLIFFLLTLTLFLITFKWKISGHMIVNTGAVFMINYLFDWRFLWLFLMVPIVAYARLYLKKHDIWQVAAGIMVGLIEPYLVLKLFGYL